MAREARGHGVPEVMIAVADNGGRIRWQVSVVKALASALTIGSGGSVGREGPIVQIGSALASGIGQWVRMRGRRLLPPDSQITLSAGDWSACWSRYRPTHANRVRTTAATTLPAARQATEAATHDRISPGSARLGRGGKLVPAATSSRAAVLAARLLRTAGSTATGPASR